MERWREGEMERWRDGEIEIWRDERSRTKVEWHKTLQKIEGLLMTSLSVIQLFHLL